MHYSLSVIPAIHNSKTAVFMSQWSETEHCRSFAQLSDSTQGKQLICSIFSSHRSELPVACIVIQHLYFCTSDQLSFHAFFTNVTSHPSILIYYRRNYTRSFDKIWSRVSTIYFWGKFHINPFGSSTRYKKKADLSNECRQVLFTINERFSNKECIQRNKSKTLIVSLFSSFSVTKTSQKSRSKVN